MDSTTDSDVDLAPCRKCEQEISTGVETCPECGFNPSRTIAAIGLGIGAIGGLLTLLIVTAIIGIPMVLIAIPIILYGLATSKPSAAGDDSEKTPWYLKLRP